MNLVAKGWVVLRIWMTYFWVTFLLRANPLHEVVAVLSRAGRGRNHPDRSRMLSRAIHRTLRLGSHRPRCLPAALVLFRLLRLDGQPAQLVIGLPSSPKNHIAHAWVELQGRDVGPPPGRGAHVEMTRYT